MNTAALTAWRTQAEEIVSGLSLEEKASLCSGADFWNTKGIERAGIRPFMLTDGPHGLRKQASEADHLGLNESVPATCFPSGAGLAASWDTSLLRAVGRALGREARAAEVGVLLGPAINIKRHPLGGRSFEYFSEDPELTGELAAAYIEGVQSEGVGTSLKHFAANNQESNRLLVDVVADERTLREIYLRGFEIAVTRAQPWTVMSAYNRLNGVYASDNAELLTGILREEWGHEGAVVSDWGAEDDRVAGVRAGMTLEMPGNGGLTDAEIIAAVRAGELEEDRLNEEVVRMVALHLAVADSLTEEAGFDPEEHHALARTAAIAATVLLKNDGGILPLQPDAAIAVLGAFAETPRYQGGGSSHINPTRLDSLRGALTAEHPGLRVEYARGYRPGLADPDPTLLAEARAVAARADVVVVIAGLTDQEESEGYDRTRMRMSAAHEALIEAALAENENVVVVLSNGSALEMPWVDRAQAIVEGYLGGQAGGSALADVLTGAAEPGGRLAETFPVRLEDAPAFLNWPGTADRVEYREGVFVGYRYYDTVGREPLFPFGHGLGYTDIAVDAVRADRDEATETESVTVTTTVTNRGTRAGSQVIQLYVHQEGAQPRRPAQELKAFAKVVLDPGQSEDVVFVLDRRAFAFWGENAAAWVVDDAAFELRIGTSSRNIAQTVRVSVHGSGDAVALKGQNTALGALLDHPVLGTWARRLREVFISGQGSYDPDSPEHLLVDAFSRELPLRALVRIGALIGQDELDRVVRVLNGTAEESELSWFPAPEAVRTTEVAS